MNWLPTPRRHQSTLSPTFSMAPKNSLKRSSPPATRVFLPKPLPLSHRSSASDLPDSRTVE